MIQIHDMQSTQISQREDGHNINICNHENNVPSRLSQNVQYKRTSCAQVHELPQRCCGDLFIYPSISIYQSIYLSIYLSKYLPTNVPTNLVTYPQCQPTNQPTYLPTYLCTYLPTYLPACLRSYQPTFVTLVLL